MRPSQKMAVLPTFPPVLGVCAGTCQSRRLRVGRVDPEPFTRRSRPARNRMESVMISGHHAPVLFRRSISWLWRGARFRQSHIDPGGATEGEFKLGSWHALVASGRLERNDIARAHPSRSRPLFSRVIQTSGDPTFGHHALARDEIAGTPSSRSRSLLSRVIQTFGDSTSGHHALARDEIAGTPSSRSRSSFSRVIQTSGHHALAHRAAGVARSRNALI
jgi:hypothetical protein